MKTIPLHVARLPDVPIPDDPPEETEDELAAWNERAREDFERSQECWAEWGRTQ